MHEAILNQARECQFCQSALIAFGSALPANDDVLDEIIAEAVRLRDHVAFTHLVLAALHAGREVDAHHLVIGASLLTEQGILSTLVWHLSGNVAEALVEAIASERTTFEPETFILLLAAQWAHERGEDKYPPNLMIRARRSARRRRDNPLDQICLERIALLTKDEGLTAILKANGYPLDAKVNAELTNTLAALGKDDVFRAVPVTAGPKVLAGYTVRRSVSRVGRNDPCPCGSGKKYKKCCADKDEERLEESSSVAGVTRTELTQCPEPYLTKEKLQQMRVYELLRLEVTRIQATLLPTLIRSLLSYSEYDAAVGVFEKLGVPAELVDWWDEVVYHVSRARRADLLRRLVHLRTDPAFKLDQIGLSARLLLARGESNPVLRLLEAEALKALHGGPGVDVMELPYALLDQYPALGIFVARSMLPIGNQFDIMVLFDALLEARDELNLPPDDAFEDIFDERMAEDSDGEPKSDELAKASRELEAKAQEVRRLKLELERMRQDLDRREEQRKVKLTQTQPPTAVSPSGLVEDGALTDLRKRLAELKETLKERHAERNQLRRDLQKALTDVQELREKATAAAPEPTIAAEKDEDRLFVPADSFDHQPVRLPAFPKKFQDSLAGYPKPVARSAMTLIGRLAAGDQAAFVGAKHLQMNHAVLRQRVGTDHRLLFRLSAETLEIIALINRRDLDRTIKNLGIR